MPSVCFQTHYDVVAKLTKYLPTLLHSKKTRILAFGCSYQTSLDPQTPQEGRLMDRRHQAGRSVVMSQVQRVTSFCDDGWCVQYKYLLSIQMESCLEEQLQIGEVVWGKVTGHPWWPGRLTQISSHRHQPYRIDFFNDSTHAFLGLHKVSKYPELRDNIDTHRHMVKRLRRAVMEADKAYSSFAERTNSTPRSGYSAEAPLSLQKQLLQPSLLQESPQHNHQSESVEQYQPTSQPEPRRNNNNMDIREQRQRYVSALLKKYGLDTIPKVMEEQPKRERKVERKFARKCNKNKSKTIRKGETEGHSLKFLLTRKIYSVLRGKELPMNVRRAISLSLTKQVLCGEGCQQMRSLFNWLAISQGRVIINFYQTWGSIQGDKDKGSNMTTEQ